MRGGTTGHRAAMTQNSIAYPWGAGGRSSTATSHAWTAEAFRSRNVAGTLHSLQHTSIHQAPQPRTKKGREGNEWRGRSHTCWR
jgi:hypothetical protein